jgi:hypothetical protein
MNDLDVSVSDPSVVTIDTNPQEKYIKLYVPYNVTDDFSGVKLKLDNRITGQHEEINLNFSAERESSEPTILGIRRSTLIDIMTFLLLVGCIVIIYNYITNTEVRIYFNFQKQLQPQYSNIKPPMGSNVRSHLNISKA